MKTTIYKLLGMVVEGKAPNKIKYEGQEWKYNPINDYEGIQFGGCLLNQVTLDRLNDKVEIIEEEKKIPEKLDWDKNDFTYPEGNLMSEETADMLMEIQDKVNFILDYLKSKGDE